MWGDQTNKALERINAHGSSISRVRGARVCLVKSVGHMGDV